MQISHLKFDVSSCGYEQNVFTLLSPSVCSKVLSHPVSNMSIKGVKRSSNFLLWSWIFSFAQPVSKNALHWLGWMVVSICIESSDKESYKGWFISVFICKGRYKLSSNVWQTVWCPLLSWVGPEILGCYWERSVLKMQAQEKICFHVHTSYYLYLKII